MKHFYLFLTTVLVLFIQSLTAQNNTAPPQFSYPCTDDQRPLSHPAADLTFIVEYEGANVEVGTFVGVFDTDGLLIGRDQVFVVEACVGMQSIISLPIYEDINDGTCAANWGAVTGEEVTVVLARNDGFFYVVPETFVFPGSNMRFADIEDENGNGNGGCNPAMVMEQNRDDSFLPVELTTFRGTAAAKQVNLNWQVAREENVSHYEVQHSTNGSNWQAIGQVAAAGNSDIALDYAFVDISATGGNNFYRLNMVDMDGSAEFSGIVIVNLGAATSEQSVELFPNPVTATDHFSIRLLGAWNDAMPISAAIMDVRGRQVAQFANVNAGSSSFALPTDITPGLYLVRIVQGDKVFTNKLSIR